MNKAYETIFTTSSEETQRLGEEFVKRLKAQDVVCLYGDLGSGKTTFVKGMAKGLGSASRIISPTFVLIRQHKIKVQSSKLKVKSLYHVDLYRIENFENIKGLGLEDLFEEKNTIVVIEWAERLGSLLPKKRWDVKFEHEDESKRKMRIKKVDC